MGHVQDGISLLPQKAKNFQLPANYTIVSAVALKKDNVVVPNPPCEIVPIKDHLVGAQGKERCWLKHVIQVMEKEELDKDDILSRSAYHAAYRTSLMTYDLLSHSSCHYSMAQLPQQL